MKKILFVLMSFLSMRGMEDGSAKTPVIFISNDYFTYIGNSDIRARLEEIYGKKFPLNMLFFTIDFRNVSGFKKFPRPDFIPYDEIEDCIEDGSLTLVLNGSPYAFLCSQRNATFGGRNNLPKKFQDMVAYGYHAFAERAHALVSGRESLYIANVISKNTASGHGENSFFSERNN
jgi:hypothetical protein